MSYNLTVNSSNVVGNNNNSFKYNFIGTGVNIPDGSELSLISATIPYSFTNINSLYGNNTISYNIPCGVGGTQTQYSITIPNGFYTVPQLDTCIKSVLYTNGHYFFNGSTIDSTKIIYPINLSVYSPTYSILITSYSIPTSANIATVIGTGYSASSSWTGSYPSGAYGASTLSCAYLVIPTTTSTTTTIGNYLGFTTGNYPSTNTGLSNTGSYINTVYSNSLSASPPFPPLGSTINAIIIRCDKVNNDITIPSDILSTLPIVNTTYGTNINFNTALSTPVKIKGGVYRDITFTLYDQNLNLITSLDPNVLLTFYIKLKI